MNTPEDYLEKLKLIGVHDMTFRAGTTVEAKEAINKVRSIEQQLRQMKREVNVDIKQVRAIYRDKAANAGEGTAGLLSFFGKRKAAGSIRADAKRSVNRERDMVVAAYDKIKLTIDDLLVQTSSVKAGMDAYIREEKGSQPLESRDSTEQESASCSVCGAKVDPSNNFCPSCGAKLR